MHAVCWMENTKNESKIKVEENKSKSLSLVGRGRPLQIVQLPQPTLYTVTIHLRHIKPNTKHTSKHHQKVQGHIMGNLRQITIWSKNKRWPKFNCSTTNTVYSNHPIKPKHNMIEKRRKNNSLQNIRCYHGLTTHNKNITKKNKKWRESSNLSQRTRDLSLRQLILRMSIAFWFFSENLSSSRSHLKLVQSLLVSKMFR